MIYEYICRHLLDIVKLVHGYGRDRMLKINFSLYINQDISFAQRSQDGTDNRQVVVRFGAGVRDLCLLESVPIGPDAHPAFYSTGTERSFTEVKWVGLQYDQSCLRRVEIKNKWSHTSTHSHVFMACSETSLF